jgi:hypothetical protein
MAIVKKENIDSKIRCLINSTNILETLYDTASKDLIVTFKSGRSYQYKNVDPKVYNIFEQSPSHGQALHQMFKNTPTTRLTDVDPTSLLTELYGKI